MKKILLISGSNRNGYSDYILTKINENIRYSELIKLRDFEIKTCKGCLYCDNNKECILKDDLSKVVDKILQADLVVIALPNYFGSMSGFFKNFIDRLHYMYKKQIIDGKKIIFIYTGAGDKRLTMEEMTEATSNIEKYLKLNVLNRYSFKSKEKEEILKAKNEIAEICNYIEDLN